MRKSSIVLLAVALFAVVGTAHADLIRQYAMNETSGATAVDQMGIADGTYIGSPALGVASAAPSLGTAVTFNGTTQYVDIGNSLGSYNISSGFTIAAWIKPTATAWLPFVGKSTWSAGGWGFGTNGTGGLVLTQPTVKSLESTSNAIATGDLGNWIHVAATYSGTNVKFYKNGVLVPTAADGVVNFGTTTAAYSIGRWDDAPFAGGIDEVRIYNSVLSGAQIAELASVPEPSSLVLGIMGAFGLLAYAWRKRK